MMIGHVTAALALVLAQPTAVPARPCITSAELGDMAVVALPEVIDSFARSCAAHLPETAFLRSDAAAFSQRLRADGAASRENAFAAVKRVAPPQMQAQLGTEAGLKAIVGMMTGSMSARLNAKTCGELSRFTQSLSPLPAANVAMMFSSAAAFGMAMRPPQAQGNQSGPPICAS